MSLSDGTRLGTYEIICKLGAGGMGEVYRAADTRLGRDVAIKTLPALLADDKDRLARFEREARLLASLNHAHIAAVHSLDEADGTLYIVMELIAGESLEQRLKSGKIPLEDALRYGLQIASALEAAHEKGVVHRDLKPANIMITPDGVIKVLDFGLAKAFAGDPTAGNTVHSPALSVAMTQQGLVLGTAGYMSPEQASGQATDQRADVWAFGVVMYEMLTGQPVFSGESVPHILADVLKTDPDWRSLPRNLHPRLRLLLERCLTKRPHSRLHSIADARIEIEAVLAAPEGLQPMAAAADEQPRKNRLPLIGAFVATAAAAVLAGWFLRPMPASEARQVARFSVPLAEGQILTAQPGALVAVSPDGSRIVYAADRQLYLRNLAESEVRAIPGTQMEGTFGASNPVFSPDGQWIAFIDTPSATGPYTIMRVPVTGGAPVRLHVAEGLANVQHGLSWPTQDRIVFTNPAGIVGIPANGGDVEVLVPRIEGERYYGPQLLADEKAVVFTSAPGEPSALSGFNDSAIVVQSIGADDRTVIRRGGRAARVLPTGHLLYAEGDSLFAMRFDAATRTALGGPVPLLDGLRGAESNFSDTANFAVSDTGTFVMLPGGSRGADGAERVRTTISWIDRNGSMEALPVRDDDYTMVRIAPDGSRAALVVGGTLARGVDPAIWIYDFDSTNLSLLTTEPVWHDGPVWSADSNRLFFRGPGQTAMAIYSIELETREVSLVYEGSAERGAFPLSWSVSPSEQTLAIINAQDASDVDFAMVSLEEGELIPGLSGEGSQNEPVFSADGAWLAYQEIRSGAAPEINIRPFPGLGRTRIPVGPGQSAVFSRDGSELFISDGIGLTAVDVTYEPTLRIGAPRELFETTGFVTNLYGRVWDPDPTGARFLMVRDPGAVSVGGGDDAERLRLEVTLNWFEELEERVPTD